MAGQAVEKADDLHETALEHTLMQPPSPREEQRFDAEGYKPNRDAQWIPDEERDCCVVCTKSFTLITRRHHCRFCYEVVCGRCSRARSWYHGTLQMERQCDKCASELDEVELRGVAATLQCVLMQCNSRTWQLRYRAKQAISQFKINVNQSKATHEMLHVDGSPALWKLRREGAEWWTAAVEATVGSFVGSGAVLQLTVLKAQ